MYASTTDYADIRVTTSAIATDAAGLSDETTVPTNTDIISRRNSNAAIQVPVFVGILVGVIVLLILLTTAVVTVLCTYLHKYRKKVVSHVDEDNGYVYDYVTERGRGIIGATNPVEMKVNKAYGTHGQANSLENATESQVFETQDEEIHCFDRVETNYT